MNVDLTRKEVKYLQTLLCNGAVESDGISKMDIVNGIREKLAIRYSIGDRFLDEFDQWCMLVAVRPRVVTMVTVEEGAISGNPVEVGSARSITEDEFARISQGRKLKTPDGEVFNES